MGSKRRVIRDRIHSPENAGVESADLAPGRNPSTQSEASNKDVIRELAGEAVGIERGFLRTLIDLTKKPADVVESYLRGDHIYLNPFRLLFSIATVWVIVMNFVLDWDAIGREYAQGLSSIFPSPESPEGIQRQVDMEAFIGMIFDALFAKYFVALVIILIPIHALLSTRFTRPLAIPFKKHLTVLAYQGSMKMGVGFIIAVGFGVHVIATMAIMFALVFADLLGWQFAGKVISGVPTQRFYKNKQEQIAKAYRKAGGVILVGAVVAGMLVGLIFAMVGRDMDRHDNGRTEPAVHRIIDSAIH